MNMRNIQIFHDTIVRLLHRGALKNLEKMIEKLHAADIVQVIRLIDSEQDRKDIFNLLTNLKKKAEILKVLDIQETISLIENLEYKKMIEIFQYMPSDAVTDIMRTLPQNISKELLKLMETRGSQVIEELLQYPADTAGGIMTTEFYAFPREITVGEAVDTLQKGLGQENIFYVYVINQEEQLIGVLSLRKLLQVKPQTPIEDIMITDVISVRTDTDQEEVAKLVARYNLLALPVIDEGNRLVGIVTVDDVVDVIRDEATEDILKMGGVGDVEVLERSSLKSVRFRLPWLFISLLGGLIAFKIMGYFQVTLQTSIILAFFIPLMMGMTGNVAIQAATIVVRGISTGKIQVKQIGWVLWKELKVGFLLGVIYGSILGSFASIQYGHSYANLGVVVGGSLLISMMLSTLIGSLLPIVFERFNIDPALSTGPFITTVVDVGGILIYLSLATFLNGTF